MTKSIFTSEYDELCRLLVDARKAKRLTQAEVARKLRRPQSFVSKYERGERRLDVVEFLDVTRAIGVRGSRLLLKLDQKTYGTGQKHEQ